MSSTAVVTSQLSGLDLVDRDVVNHAKALPLDVVQSKGSGHAGTAVSLTPAMYVLFQQFLRHDPSEPDWWGRDRFVLSCGHASLALYVQLYLSGYGLDMDDLRATRTLGSRTPGHPEYGRTAGVETSTGPLGQGLGNAVGMAMAARRLSAMLEPDASADTALFRSRVWCFASDGDLQEGVGHEACSLAGTLGLDNLIVIWDDNGISIEGPTATAFREDVLARYTAYGWATVSIDDAEDLQAIDDGFAAALRVADRPVLVRLRSRIGYPMPTLGGTAAAHAGPAGPDEVAATKRALGLDPTRTFDMPDDLLAHARRVSQRGRRAHRAWDGRVAAWREQHPGRAALLDSMATKLLPQQAESTLDRLSRNPKAAPTRTASEAVLREVVPLMPALWGGSADLAESNGTMVPSARSFYATNRPDGPWPGGPDGTLVHFGIREHAMGAIVNGIALGGPFRPFAATYFVFSDYMRPSVRLAGLMRLPVTYVWSHDSVAVGEDGPTHQPVEQLWSYRTMPNLAVVRPADWTETVESWRRILRTTDGPTALVLSRQSVPVRDRDNAGSIGGAERGAYVVAGAATPDVVIVATGSEVQFALEARRELARSGVDARVVSMPCLEWFAGESAEYRDSVLPPAVPARVSIEAGTSGNWRSVVGDRGEIVSIDRYGESGAGDAVLQQCGITADAVVQAALRTLASCSADAASRSEMG